MRKLILYFSFTLLIIGFLLLFIFWWKIKTPLSPSEEIKIFKVLKGESAEAIAEHLQDSGLIKRPFLFRLYVFLSLRQYALKSGDYEFSPSMSIRDIADTIVLGGTNEILITIPPGFNLKQIEERLIEARLAQKNELVNYKFSDTPPPLLSDKPKASSFEGYLFPDTYRFFKDSALSDIISKMISNLDSRLAPDLKVAIKNSSHSTYEILTMASLIEKEVTGDADREIVSGILWKRLETSVPLQVDATLVYITGRQEVLKDDKKINSPYNTYLYNGLPKGPIASPGLSAIKASIFPKISPYWYYLSAKDGRTIFSVTLAEHNRNKALYLK